MVFGIMMMVFRSICVFISGFSNERKKQLSIFDVSSDDYYDIKRDDKLQSVIDDIRDKYGNNVIGYGSNNNDKGRYKYGI